MTARDDQVQHGYYYAPLENGRYANEGRELGSVLLEMGIEAFSKSRYGATWAGAIKVVNNALGNPIGAVGGFIGEGAGWYVDNLTNIQQNVNTMLNELNNPGSWHQDLEM